MRVALGSAYAPCRTKPAAAASGCDNQPIVTRPSGRRFGRHQESEVQHGGHARHPTG